jgi:hypothetical protein
MPGLTAFLLLLLEDPGLRAELLAAPDLPALFALVLARAGERGIAISEEELHAAVLANRRSWHERWTGL